MILQLRDGSHTSDPRLDRIVQFDERSRNFPVTAVAPTGLRSKVWTQPASVRLDQGQQGSCVGHGWSHSFLTNPGQKRDGTIDHLWAVQFYYQCQRADEWPGGEYPGATPNYSGTSNLAGAKNAKARGFCDAYHWCFSIDDVMQALSHVGPVVVATNWNADMWEPTPDGLIESVGGANEGGHCYLLRQLILKPKIADEPIVRMTNSWGLSWGVGGEAFFRVSDFEKLLKNDGDACVPTGKKKGS